MTKHQALRTKNAAPPPRTKHAAPPPRTKNSAKRFLFVISALCGLPAVGHALWPVADGDVILNLSSTAGYDSNIFRNANEQDDFFATLTPEFQFLRQSGIINLDARAGVEVTRFADFTEQNSEDLFASAKVSYPNRVGFNPTYGTFGIGWLERTSTSEFVGRRIEAETFDTNATLRRHFSDRLAARGSAFFQDTAYVTGGYSDRQIWSVGGEAVHLYSDYLDLFLGYRYRNTDTDGRGGRPPLQIHDHLLHVGAEGQLLPKTTGRATVGIQGRYFDQQGMDDRLRPYGSFELNWQARPRTAVLLLAARDFDTTPDDRSVDETSFRLSIDQQVGHQWSVAPGISYRRSEVEWSQGATRTDDEYGATISATYSFVRGATAFVRYNFLTRDSTDPFFEYDRHLFEVGGRVSF